MINLNIYDLNKIKMICEEVGTEYFTLEEENKSGIGSIITVSYQTMIADYPATVKIGVRGMESW